MKILCIYPYSSAEIIFDDKHPTQMFKGICTLSKTFSKKGNLITAPLSDEMGMGEVNIYLAKEKVPKSFKKLSLIFQRLYRMLKLMFTVSKYEVVYDTFFQVTMFFGLMKKIGLYRKTKFIALMHSPEYFKVALKIAGGADAYIFFCEKHLNYAMKLCPALSKRYIVNEWYPDTKRYNKIRNQIGEVKCTNFYIDNGVTMRDRLTLLNACRKSEIGITLPKRTVSGIEKKLPKSITLYDFCNLEQMVKLLLSHKAIIIPIAHSDTEVAPFGITTFLDAIAFQLPIICSDSACFSSIVADNDLGLIYEASSADDLAEKMKQLYNDKELYQKFVNNLTAYSLTHTIEKTGEKLGQIIMNVMSGKEPND